MNVLALLQDRIAAALAGWTDDVAPLAEMVRPSQDPKFGDYQANCAMPLAKQLGRPPRDVAAEIVRRLDVREICQPPEIAGPGFINFRLDPRWLTERILQAVGDQERLAVEESPRTRTILLDYSSPNVAKPMHVGHIRSTVIGDSLYRVLAFLGHRAISDNHLGDWGTQFGMILYGYKHFLDAAAYASDPVEELGRLYRRVHSLVEYHAARDEVLPDLRERIALEESQLEATTASLEASAAEERKKLEKTRKQSAARLAQWREDLAAAQDKVRRVEQDPQLSRAAAENPTIGQAVLEETARLHAGDGENVRLWKEFLPPCVAAIDKIYDRLGVRFDHTLGESYYHDRLPAVVRELRERGLATVSDGAVCVFVQGQPAPMLIEKKDGAYLYATTDLATLRYRMETFQPDDILYVVDHRQSLHFEQLFAVARLWGFDRLRLEHVSFGTVLGDDGRPFRTRSGDSVGLTGLLDEAVRRAGQIVAENDDAKATPELSPDERARVAEVVGIGALKYADLSQNRTSDYVFSYDKMLAMKGNTATYMQYSYARVRSIFARGEVSPEELVAARASFRIEHPTERALAVELARFSETLQRVASDLRPNHLTSYLFDVASRFSEFFEQCPVLKAESADLRASRLVLCDLTARTIRKGLELLGIQTVEKM